MTGLPTSIENMLCVCGGAEGGEGGGRESRALQNLMGGLNQYMGGPWGLKTMFLKGKLLKNACGGVLLKLRSISLQACSLT